LLRSFFTRFHDIKSCPRSRLVISEGEPRGSVNFPPALTTTTFHGGDDGWPRA
jgi:hypothetical protein